MHRTFTLPLAALLGLTAVARAAPAPLLLAGRLPNRQAHPAEMIL